MTDNRQQPTTKFGHMELLSAANNIYYHLTEFNGGFGLQNLSEECLEALHKDERFLRLFLARGTCREDNFYDTMFRFIARGTWIRRGT